MILTAAQNKALDNVRGGSKSASASVSRASSVVSNGSATGSKGAKGKGKKK